MTPDDGGHWGALAQAAADAVRAVRANRHMNRAQFARHVGMTADAVRSLERGASVPGLATLFKLADGAGVSPVTLVRDIDARRRGRP